MSLTMFISQCLMMMSHFSVSAVNDKWLPPVFLNDVFHARTLSGASLDRGATWHVRMGDNDVDDDVDYNDDDDVDYNDYLDDDDVDYNDYLDDDDVDYNDDDDDEDDDYDDDAMMMMMIMMMMQ